MKKFRDSITNHITAIAGLILVSLATIGFSSWSLGGGGVTGDNGNLNIEIGSYGDFKDCIFIDDSKENGGVQPLLFSDKGFVGIDGLSNASSIGIMSVDIKIDLKKAQAKVSTNDVYIVSNLMFEGTKKGNATGLDFIGSDMYLNSTLKKDGTILRSQKTGFIGENLFLAFKSLTSQNEFLELHLDYKIKPKDGHFNNFYNEYLNNTSNNSHLAVYITLGEKNA